MILTSNRGFVEWGEVFGDPVVTTALLDRLLHHAVVIQIEGSSYRLHQHAALVPENVRAEAGAAQAVALYEMLLAPAQTKPIYQQKCVGSSPELAIGTYGISLSRTKPTFRHGSRSDLALILLMPSEMRAMSNLWPHH
jgi:hypothetical protein